MQKCAEHRKNTKKSEKLLKNRRNYNKKTPVRPFFRIFSKFFKFSRFCGVFRFIAEIVGKRGKSRKMVKIPIGKCML